MLYHKKEVRVIRAITSENAIVGHDFRLTTRLTIVRTSGAMRNRVFKAAKYNIFQCFLHPDRMDMVLL